MPDLQARMLAAVAALELGASVRAPPDALALGLLPLRSCSFCFVLLFVLREAQFASRATCAFALPLAARVPHARAGAGSAWWGNPAPCITVSLANHISDGIVGFRNDSSKSRAASRLTPRIRPLALEDANVAAAMATLTAMTTALLRPRDVQQLARRAISFDATPIPLLLRLALIEFALRLLLALGSRCPGSSLRTYTLAFCGSCRRCRCSLSL